MQVRCWVKAFIPEAVYAAAGQELTWRPEPKTYGSMLPLQPYYPSLTASYATDQRSFSADINASARITTTINISASENSDIIVNRYSDPTIQLSQSWKALFTSQQDRIETLTSQPSGEESIDWSENKLNIFFATHGSNPFFSVAGVNYAPPISMYFNLCITHDVEKNVLKASLTGVVSQFPAFEAYIQIDNKEPVTLLRHAPEPGHTPFELIYGATEVVRGSHEFRAYNAVGLFATKKVKSLNEPVVMSKKIKGIV